MAQGREPLDDALIARFVAGQCSPAERRQVETRIARDPAAARAVHEAERVWALAEPASVPFHQHVLWARIQREARQQATRRPTRLTLALRAPLTAVSIVVAVAAFAAVMMRGPYFLDSILRRRSYTYATSPGERRVISLPDRSTAELGPATQLTFNDNLLGRQLTLRGEARFNVAHSAWRPFVVHTSDLETRDRGTVFVIHAYPSDSQTSLYVEDGSVTVRPLVPTPSWRADSVIALSRGMAATYASGRASVRTPRTSEPWFSWTSERLTFDRTALRQALPELSRWFNITCSVADTTLLQRTITGSFGSESLPDVAHELAVALRLRARINGVNLVLSRR